MKKGDLVKRMEYDYERKYEWLPDEVTNYGFDQMVDRLEDKGVDAKVSWNSETKKFGTDSYEAFETFQSAMDEKLFDMEWEVRHGERDDYDRGFLQSCRDKLDRFLRGEVKADD